MEGHEFGPGPVRAGGRQCGLRRDRAGVPMAVVTQSSARSGLAELPALLPREDPCAAGRARLREVRARAAPSVGSCPRSLGRVGLGTGAASFSSVERLARAPPPERAGPTASAPASRTTGMDAEAGPAWSCPEPLSALTLGRLPPPASWVTVSVRSSTRGAP